LKAIEKPNASSKGDTVMKRTTALAILAIANLAMAGTSFAQSNGVKANVPFDFTVGNQLLPSGTYTITNDSSHLIVIKNHDKPITVLSLVMADGKTSRNGGKLVFHNYGGQYFLSEILCDEEDMNLALWPSKTETRARMQQATLHPSSDTFVAAR
jgi:hypothetical protein